MSSVFINLYAHPKLEPRKEARNGSAPRAETQNAIAEHAGHWAAIRTDMKFSRSTPIANLPNSASGTRERWRSAFHTSPFCKTLNVEMRMAQQSNGSATNPYGKLQVFDSSDTLIAVAKVYFGATSSATDVPSNFGGGAVSLVSPTNDQLAQDLLPDTDYTLLVTDEDYGRIISIAVWERTLAADTNNGYASTGSSNGSPVFDEDRAVPAAMVNSLWHRGGRQLWNWCSETDATAPEHEAEAIAPTYVTATALESNAFASSSDSVTVTWPTVEDDDIAYLIATDKTATPSLSGAGAPDWTSITNNNGTWIWRARASGSMDPVDVEATHGESTALLSAFMVIVRGASTGTPEDEVTGGSASGTTDVNITGTSTTTSVDHTLLLGILVATTAGEADFVSGFAHTETVTGLTQRTEDTASGGGSNHGYAVVTAELEVAGEGSNFTATLANSYNQTTFLIAVKS